jgi:RNA polymerase sigma-70 factor (ECF subfamily)
MTGNPCDGEDVLQEALVLAFYRSAELRDRTALRAWLFRIAHNKCIDFVRGRRRFDPLDDERETEELRTMDESIDDKQRVARALTSIVTELPPKERACVVLKDVLECSLEETAEITGASVGAVKAALHRGREKIDEAARTPRTPTRMMPPQQRAVVERYVEAFNRHDWDGVRALLAHDARLEVVHRTEGPFRESSYFVNYGRLKWAWKLELADVDGIESLVHFRENDGAWIPHGVVRLTVENGEVSHVRDYVHVDYLLRDCVVRRLDP